MHRMVPVGLLLVLATSQISIHHINMVSSGPVFKKSLCRVTPAGIPHPEFRIFELFLKFLVRIFFIFYAEVY